MRTSWARCQLGKFGHELTVVPGNCDLPLTRTLVVTLPLEPLRCTVAGRQTNEVEADTNSLLVCACVGELSFKSDLLIYHPLTSRRMLSNGTRVSALVKMSAACLDVEIRLTSSSSFFMDARNQ
jgi:hypothetical protein